TRAKKKKCRKGLHNIGTPSRSITHASANVHEFALPTSSGHTGRPIETNTSRHYTHGIPADDLADHRRVPGRHQLYRQLQQRQPVKLLERDQQEPEEGKLSGSIQVESRRRKN